MDMLAKMFNQMKLFAFAALIFIAAFELIGLAMCRPDVNGMDGKYFPNLEWQGEPAFTTLDTDLSTDTLAARKEQFFPGNRYSVEWNGYLEIQETAAYTFFLESDDGSLLSLDGQVVVDNGGVHGLIEKEGTLYLRKGLHPFTIRYLQSGGYAVLRIAWKKADADKRPLSSLYLYPPTISVWYVIAYRLLPYMIFASGILVIIAGNGCLPRERITAHNRNADE